MKTPLSELDMIVLRDVCALDHDEAKAKYGARFVERLDRIVADESEHEIKERMEDFFDKVNRPTPFMLDTFVDAADLANTYDNDPEQVSSKLKDKYDRLEKETNALARCTRMLSKLNEHEHFYGWWQEKADKWVERIKKTRSDMHFISEALEIAIKRAVTNPTA